jgi:survival-of-motor-neuron-related-splicing factor 30
MDVHELASYRYQLEQVEELLANDPNNAEMLKLKKDLQDLINLSTELVGASQATTSKSATASSRPSTATASKKSSGEDEEEVDALLKRTEISLSQRPISLPDDVAIYADDVPLSKWSVGDRIRARYKGDGKLYTARVVSVGGTDAAPIYSVVFKGYEDKPEIVAHADTRRLMGAKTAGGHGPKTPNGPTTISASTSVVRKREAKSNENDEDSKRLKGSSARKLRQAEQRERQQAWLKFASGTSVSKKKSKKISILNKKSMFSTPDNPNGRVGVIGSGKPMTQFNQRHRHVYVPEKESDV